ncbi:hypothetical protein L3Y21_gp081 [Gordonia phage Rabbitrun]|uniref:Lipoprotein n=1 Tax=Gordonia phage Rabbitrun TaxID=2762280 RepID=A0A7G8LIQ0_9CAUD|nr:hypothetical protein L3Y21_gp081 [Gordonia phage Rabbitrun]QNJ57122.1 hypothetical protein SEA_RABBITRUN_81 [Gordonia phage Rabbitrun]
MKKTVAAVLIAAVAGLGLTACHSDDDYEDVSAVCVDPATNVRLDDDECDDDDGPSVWWYYGAGAAVPAVGYAVAKNSGSFKKPARAHIRKVPRVGQAKPSVVKPRTASAPKPTQNNKSWFGSKSSGSGSKSSSSGSRSGGFSRGR